jgi:hypothetical protein
VSLHLVQNGREDPFVPGRPRELRSAGPNPAHQLRALPEMLPTVLAGVLAPAESADRSRAYGIVGRIVAARTRHLSDAAAPHCQTYG